MRISIFTDSFLPYISGVTTCVLNQANEFRRRGHAVQIHRPRPPRSADGLPGLNRGVAVHNLLFSLPVCRFPQLRLALPLLLPTLFRLRRFRPDVIHTHTEWGCGIESLMASRLLKTPLVATLHTFYADPGYLQHLPFSRGSGVHRALWAFLMAFYNKCNAVITPSHSALDELTRRGLRPPSFLIENGIGAPRLRDPAFLLRRRRELGLEGGPHFIYVGRISQEKSLDVLARAFARVAPALPESRLILVGDGPGKPDLARLFASLGIASRVTDLGMIPHDRLIDENVPLLGDVFVTASKTENHPVSLLEALAFGLPMIGPGARGIPELIRHEVNGLIFPADDTEALAAHMQLLAIDPALRRRLHEGALSGGARYLMQRAGDRLEEAYDAVLGRAPAPSAVSPQAA
ncbi:MAG TPA: glycosyltransferase [Verrucomicrobiales bacterium]|nr:glycosyltransferase [Verrucomicrobiales bacterium]